MTKHKEIPAATDKKKGLIPFRILVVCGIVMAVTSVVSYNSMFQLKDIAGAPGPMNLANCIAQIVAGLALTVLSVWQLRKRLQK